ncbi:MAG: baseplate J/gp47 family protein [Burkholderiales bacterium]|nr:baseplate J/gp47 family protein [Burkholderiales bacterium]
MSTFDLSTSTASTLSAVDLSKLPFPEFLADRNYETILAEMIADVNNFCVEKTGQSYIAHEADPAYIVLEACAYRRWMDIKDYQAQIKNNLVAYATGEWLDHLGANPDFKCPRLVIVPADDTTTPPTEAVMESDDAYRARLVLTNEGYTTAGSAGSYLFHALSADGDVRDASVQSPIPGQVLVCVMSYSNDGVASAALIDAVQTKLSADTVRPLCDAVTTQAATINAYTVTMSIVTYPETDITDAIARAKTSVQAYCESHRRIGHDITRAGLIAAAMVLGVQNISLTAPASDLITDLSTARRCASVTVTHAEVAL